MWASVNMAISRSIHIAANGIISFFFFFFGWVIVHCGLSWWLSGKKSANQYRKQVWSLVRSPGEEKGYPLQYSCLENSMDRGACPWGCKELDRTEWRTLIYILGASLVAQMVKNLPAIQETWVQSLGWEDPTAKGMATLSSILAWRIPWTEEPGG